MEEIFNIIYGYSLQSKILDESAIKKITFLLLEINEIDSISEVNVKYKEDKDNTSIAYIKGNEIAIYMTKIYEVILGKMLTDIYDDDICLFLRDNLFIYNTILHEVEHAKEDKKVFYSYLNKERDMETKLLTLENDYVMDLQFSQFHDGYKSSLKPDFNYKEELRNYKRNYDISFSERMANIHAYEGTITLIDPLKDKYPKLIGNLKDRFDVYRIIAYKNLEDEPTKRFFTNIYKLNEFSKINFEDLSFEERLNFGLKIPTEEYNNHSLRYLKRRN